MSIGRRNMSLAANRMGRRIALSYSPIYLPIHQLRECAPSDKCLSACKINTQHAPWEKQRVQRQHLRRTSGVRRLLPNQLGGGLHVLEVPSACMPIVQSHSMSLGKGNVCSVVTHPGLKM